MTNHTDTSRSDDLVKRLRAGDLCGLTLAADHIEALEANLNQMTAICHGWRLQSGEQEERIEALGAENERLHEELAAAYIKLSGTDRHASDCATSNAPAMKPGPCDCDFAKHAQHTSNEARAALGDTE